MGLLFFESPLLGETACARPRWQRADDGLHAPGRPRAAVESAQVGLDLSCPMRSSSSRTSALWTLRFRSSLMLVDPAVFLIERRGPDLTSCPNAFEGLDESERQLEDSGVLCELVNFLPVNLSVRRGRPSGTAGSVRQPVFRTRPFRLDASVRLRLSDGWPSRPPRSRWPSTSRLPRPPSVASVLVLDSDSSAASALRPRGLLGPLRPPARPAAAQDYERRSSAASWIPMAASSSIPSIDGQDLPSRPERPLRRCGIPASSRQMD